MFSLHKCCLVVQLMLLLSEIEEYAVDSVLTEVQFGHTVDFPTF